MFCPKCATQNNEGAKFCRLCGADISLISQAMTGQAPEPIANDDDDDRSARRLCRKKKTPSIERGIKSLFMGLGFLFVALALSYAREGRGWWYWMLIPAFSMIGGGIADYVRAKQAREKLPVVNGYAQTAIPRGPQNSALPPRNTNELVPQPVSVTEGTTRHLGSEGPTRVFVSAERPKQ